MDPYELSCFRTIFNCTVSTLIMKVQFNRSAFEVPAQFYSTLFFRSFFGCFGFLAMTIALAYLPISVYATIINTQPFCISILSYFILQETLLRREIIGMFVCFGAVLLIVNSKQSSEDFKAYDQYYILGILLALFQAFSQGLVQVLTRKMKSIHFSVLQVNYTFLASLI